MKTIGDKLGNFSVVGVKPGVLAYEDSSFETLTQDSFAGKWKILVFYPKDFTFVCPTEIVAYDKLSNDFNDRNAVLLTGSVDNEYCKIAWRNADPSLKQTNSWMFADSAHTLANDIGIHHTSGVTYRATVIVDPDNIIQHITINNLNVGRNANETLRVLDALQTGEKTACDRPVGGETL
jgi:peroxiredoxin (alkyl hydroperoxide reductase subunit C)